MTHKTRHKLSIDENFKSLLAGPRPDWQVHIFSRNEFKDESFEEKITFITEPHLEATCFERFCVHSFEAIHQEAKRVQEEWNIDELNSGAVERIKSFCFSADWANSTAHALQTFIEKSVYDLSTPFHFSEFDNFREGYLLYKEWNFVFIIWRTDQKRFAFCCLTTA